MKKITLLPLTALFLIAGLCLTGCERILPAKKANYTVSFDLNGAAGSIASQTITEGAKVAQPDAPTRDGYTFDGWYTDEATTQAYDFTTATVTATITLYAKWVAAVANGFLIPDVNFRTYLKENISDAFEGEYMDTTHSSVLDLTLLSVGSRNISSLAGIEYFTALTELVCNDNSLAALDVTQNTALTLLYCYNNSLAVLDVTQNTALTQLYCSNNSLAALDVTQNMKLVFLNFRSNSLTKLDVTKNTALAILWCSANSLTALDGAQNTALISLDCQGNQLSSLDLRGRKSFTLLVIDASTATNPLRQLYIHEDVQTTYGEIKETKKNRGANVTISTYDDANKRICADFDPNEGEAGTCKD